jgi:hypothetical protein
VTSKSATKYRKIQQVGTPMEIMTYETEKMESMTLDVNRYRNISTKIAQASNSSCKWINYT